MRGLVRRVGPPPLARTITLSIPRKRELAVAQLSVWRASRDPKEIFQQLQWSRPRMVDGGEATVVQMELLCLAHPLRMRSPAIHRLICPQTFPLPLTRISSLLMIHPLCISLSPSLAE
jgi:hypothetical protein